MGAGGRPVHPPDKQTNNPGSSLSLYNTNNNAMYFGHSRWIGIVVEEITEQRLADNNNWNIRTNNYSSCWGLGKTDA